jgi:hypothetical protein
MCHINFSLFLKSPQRKGNWRTCFIYNVLERQLTWYMYSNIYRYIQSWYAVILYSNHIRWKSVETESAGVNDLGLDHQ